MSDLPPPPPPPGSTTCPNCGAPVTPGQHWCLNCGAAVTTEIARAGGWRTPIVIVAVVLLLAAAALVVAFVELSGEADKQASKPATTPVPTGPSGPTGVATGPSGVSGVPSGPTGVPSGPTGPVETSTPAPTSVSSVGQWPAGKTAYTVILFSESSYSSAKAKARSVSSLPQVGVLKSSKFSTLRAGYYVVFSGQYDTLGAAQTAAKSADAQAPGAYAKQVKPK
jgi:hypothetical protein